MAQAQKSAPARRPLHAWLCSRSAVGALLLLAVALLAAQAVLRFASVCPSRFSAAEGAAIAAGVLLTGMVFNWLSVDALMAEVLPLNAGLSVALGALLSLALMAGAIQSAFMALRPCRRGAAAMAWLAVTLVLAGAYAVTSALGFCLIARGWLA